MARELGLELAQLQGTGPGGRIVKADVEAAAKGDGAKAEAAEAEGPEAEPEREEKKAPPAVVSGEAQTGKGETSTQDLTRLQQTVARRMAESKATAPDFVLNVDVDMEEAVDLRKRLKAAAAEGQPVPSFNDFVVKASALALLDFPRANGAYRDGKFELYSRVNVGIAVAGQDALVVPTVFDADTKSLGQIAQGLARARGARARRRDHAAGAVVGHVHGLQPRHVRHPELRRGDQPAAGGDPRRRRDGADAGGARRRGRGPQHHAAHARLRPPHPLRRRRRRVPRAHPRAAREPAAARAVGQRGSRPVTGASVSSTAPATSSTVSTTSFDRRLNGLGHGLDDGRDGLAGLPDDALHRAGRLARRRRRRRRSGTAARALPVVPDRSSA